MKKDTQWFTIRNLYPNIWGIGEFGHFEKVISYLFIGRKQALLFDSGMGIENIREVVSNLTDLPVTLVNSHTHYDHIGGNSGFTDIFLFNTEFSRDKAKKGYPHDELSAMLEKTNFFTNPPRSFTRKNFFIPGFLFTQLYDQDEIHINPFRFLVIHTPGHTPDSICLFERTTNILLTGDTIYPGPIYLHNGESNKKDYIESIEKLREICVQTVLPGHNDFFCDVDVIHKIAMERWQLQVSSQKEIRIDTDTSLVLIR